MRDDVLGDSGDVQALTMHEEGVASDGGARSEVESLVVQGHRDRWEREVVPADGAPPPVARVRAEVRTRGESGEGAGRQGVPHHLLLGRLSLLSMAQQQCPTENGHQC